MWKVHGELAEHFYFDDVFEQRAANFDRVRFHVQRFAQKTRVDVIHGDGMHSYFAITESIRQFESLTSVGMMTTRLKSREKQHFDQIFD